MIFAATKKKKGFGEMLKSIVGGFHTEKTKCGDY